MLTNFLERRAFPRNDVRLFAAVVVSEKSRCGLACHQTIERISGSGWRSAVLSQWESVRETFCGAENRLDMLNVLAQAAALTSLRQWNWLPSVHIRCRMTADQVDCFGLDCPKRDRLDRRPRRCRGRVAIRSIINWPAFVSPVVTSTSTTIPRTSQW